MNEPKLRKLCKELSLSIVHKNHQGWLICACPFAPYLHEYGTDKNPSFNLHVNSEGYSGFNCFTCGQRGNLTKLINTLADFREVDYGKLATRTLIDETPEGFQDFDEREKNLDSFKQISPIEATIYMRMYPMASESKEAIEYMKNRGISRKASELLDLRFDPDQKRILFPVYDIDKKLYGFTGRTILDNEYITRGYPKVKDYVSLPKSEVLLGEHLVMDDKPIVVVEGLFALAHIVTLGVCDYASPVATMGSHLSEAQRDLLVSHGVNVFMLYDWDKAGKEGLWGVIDKKTGEYKGNGAISKLKEHTPTFRCLYPEDVDDPDLLESDELKDMILGDRNELC